MKILMILTMAILLSIDCISQAGEPAVAAPVKIEQAEQLRSVGFTVYDMDGGITAWKAAGKPVAK